MDQRRCDDLAQRFVLQFLFYSDYAVHGEHFRLCYLKSFLNWGFGERFCGLR